MILLKPRLLWDCHTHTFGIASCLQTNFYSKFSNLVLEKQSLETSCLEKQAFGKNRFSFRKRDFHQNKVQILLVLIYDHTLVFISLELYFVYSQSNDFIPKFPS